MDFGRTGSDWTIAHQVRQDVTALRNFEPPYDRLGSFTADAFSTRADQCRLLLQ
jgi:hypothetical protein